ncbi:RNA-binding motif protein 25 [Rutidosis leptorrhynchoides]|uniref:RNA-binding motif protein 25 n=1 Tax=Rutidosis leptorrhynchoides TaxID=125765 RepID=UPI003A99A451
MMPPYQVPPNPAMRPYAPMPNGYAPKGTMLPLGMPRFPSPYPTMVRPTFPPRPPGAIGVLPALARPLVPGVPGVRPLTPPIIIRPPVLPAITPAEKPLTTVYVSRIPVTADNEFMLSLLKFCGPVKSWKRPQDLRNGTPKGFGFCEFESAEGVLRALRLLRKFSLDGQELALIVDQATTEYLERYVEKKTENSKKNNKNQVSVGEKENQGSEQVEKKEPSKEDSKKNDDAEKKENRDMTNFGIVTDEDREADRETMEKLKGTTEEWLKTRPPPPPPPPPPAPRSVVDASGNLNANLPPKSIEGDSDVDLVKSDAADDKNDDETTSDNKTTSEHDRPKASPDRRRYDRRGRDRDREQRDQKNDKEREIERYEREAERERIRKEREQRRKIEDAERAYEDCLREWEFREKEKERQRNQDKDREKERHRKRKKEVRYDEDEDDDDSRRRSHRSILEEKRKRKQREKEDDVADRLKEEEEIAEAKRRAEEEQKLQQQQLIDSLKLLPGDITNGGEKVVRAEQSTTVTNDKSVHQVYPGDSCHGNSMMDCEGSQNGTHDEPVMISVTVTDTQQSGNAVPKKWGFGLSGSGKRSAVLSVFNEEDDEEASKENKMRPLVPIDYSTEEIQAVQQPSGSGATPPNLAAAAEFAKRISNVNVKEEKPDGERERSRHSHDRSSSHRDRDRSDEKRIKEENKEKISDRHKDRDRGIDKAKTPDNKKLLYAKQLIDMIPKTKEELFSYEINWDVYDKHELHERMRPWITKKITDFLGEEEVTLIDYIVNSTREHMKASEMLEQLIAILDEEAEMFVLKMWRMLIFEIKKVETGISTR